MNLYPYYSCGKNVKGVLLVTNGNFKEVQHGRINERKYTVIQNFIQNFTP